MPTDATTITFTADVGERPAAAEIAEIAGITSASCIATRIRRLSRIITRVYDEAVRPLGITARQFTLLTLLAQQDGITAVQIRFPLDIGKSTLSRNLKRLFAPGLIAMGPLGGRRGRGLRLTPKGQAMIKEAYPMWQSAQQKATTVMGQHTRTTLDSLLAHAERR